jgi:hypothetical protein
MKSWSSPESWKIVLPKQAGQFSVWRDGNSVYFNQDNETGPNHELRLKSAPDNITSEYAQLRTAYQIAADKYPKFKDLLYYRWKVTYFLILLFILQEIVFFIYKKRKGLHYTGLRIFAMTGWISIVVAWQIVVYLKT